MICEDARLHLTALLDGELTETEVALLQQHLAACPACAEEFHALASVQTLAAVWQIEGSAVWNGVHQALQAVEMRDLLAEMQKLREELEAARLEVARLRQEIAGRAPLLPRKPSLPLFPYAPASAAPRHLV